ncbi:MAG: response regulator, partial [Prolixibacteraceae bacterium]
VFMLKKVSLDVSRGLAEINIPPTGNDEFGILAGSFRKVVARNNELAIAANAIGKGDYDVPVSASGKDDILKNSLIQMRNNLKVLSEENQKRSWLLSGLSQLNDLMSGSADLEQLSKKIIDFLCDYTGSGPGALFIQNQQNIYLFSAGYGMEHSGNQNLSFKSGEGIAGEAVLKQKPVVISDVPEKNFKIKTGFSETGPMQLLIIPAVYENETIAVLEIASKDGFTELHQQFFNDAAERIAIAVRTLKSNIETQELLHETQSQAEELENQQNELKQINTELNQQRDELEASEEELRAGQQEMEEKNAELEEKTAELEEQHEILSAKNRELEEARQVIELKIKQVEAISEYKTEFLANMSHELRTPLNSIMLLSKILMDNARLNGNEKDAEHANIIHSSGKDLLKLINDILDLSRVESGKIELDIRETNVRSLNAPEEFKEQAKNKNITYTVKIEKNVPEQIKTDQFRLGQIIRNLLSNAFKFTPEGGKIDFHVYNMKNPENLHSDRLKGAQEVVAFAVKDNGVGIPDEKQEAIFEAFRQADASTTRKFGGTGLGLSICRELSALLGGEIQLESEIEKGSTFTLYLPVDPKIKAGKKAPELIPPVKQEKTDFTASPAAHSVSPPETKTKAAKNGTSIMIIEDDKGFNNVLADFARNKQFHVEQAFTGAEGLKKLHKSPPDALLLDVNLPDMTGWDILRNMIKNNLLKRVQVHIMTAYDYKNELTDYPAFNNFLQKPVTLESVSKAFLKIAGKNEQLKSMLIIEDNEVENHAIADLLNGHGIATISAFSGKEALEKMKADKPDGVILDLKLPDTDGYQVMEEIRKKDAELPIIVYSGKDIDIQEERKLKKYANTIIIKNDYSYQRLMDEVKLFLHQVDRRLTDKKQFKIDLHVPDTVLKNKKVLLVDDDVRNIYSLYSVLEKEGMKIIVANDGKEAIEKLKEAEKVDIILMDVMMPEMDGIETTKKIKKMPEYRNIPVIAVTAKAMMEDREKCIQAGASDYVSKPIDIEKLVSLMRVWVYDAK